MRKTKMISAKVEKTVDIICNCCKDSCRSDGDFHNINVNYCAGYGSPIFGDGAEIHFDLCEACLDDLIKLFNIKPETNY